MLALKKLRKNGKLVIREKGVFAILGCEKFARSLINAKSRKLTPIAGNIVSHFASMPLLEEKEESELRQVPVGR